MGAWRRVTSAALNIEATSGRSIEGRSERTAPTSKTAGSCRRRPWRPPSGIRPRAPVAATASNGSEGISGHSSRSAPPNPPSSTPTGILCRPRGQPGDARRPAPPMPKEAVGSSLSDYRVRAEAEKVVSMRPGRWRVVSTPGKSTPGRVYDLWPRRPWRHTHPLQSAARVTRRVTLQLHTHLQAANT